MAGLMKSWRLLVLFSLLSITELFEVREDEWEELGPDIAALHRLKGLREHMFHERFKNPSNQRNSSIHGARVERSSSRVDIDQNPMSLQDDLQECESFTACVIQKEQDFDSFLAAVEEHKIQDWLLSASEISHSYSRKLLVMTDKEKSTNDRVQHEYSMDPHYSVRVSNECLFNATCVPEANSYTVVKIFGSVSEDGQRVSGLSGSSLAELMLKQSLGAAPVFSLDGNTTTDFQHNFIRVFKVRGIKAVLETNMENHQIYQVMNEHDSVSGYWIPQRPVDHTTQYDHQQILIMEDDPTVKQAAMFLYEKHPAVSSVYTLDENQRPQKIHGDSVPLSEDSRLVLVGHGTRDESGEMKLAGNTAQDVAEIIQQTFRNSDKIKTTSVVACDVGSDKAFVETLLKKIHEGGIETELHLRDTLLQVRHTGEKITQEISKEGLQWRHKDDSKKVVAILDRKGDVIIRNEPGSKGEAIFTNERNFLKPNKRFLVYRDSWPKQPKRFIDQNVFETYADQNEGSRIREACDELEALSWGLFHADLPLPNKVNAKESELKHYLIGDKIYNNNKNEYEMNWIQDKQKIKDVLSKCIEIKSGKDFRNVIRHYAKTGEDKTSYLMVKDWIYEVDPLSLYVFPVGKRLNNNQREDENRINEVKDCIRQQIGGEKYKSMRKHINDKESYAKYVNDIFLQTDTIHLPLSTEAWSTTYFTASVICESARNFRTFPLILMALKINKEGSNEEIRKIGLDFLWEEHSMAGGGTWIDPSRRGFSGSATAEGSSKLENIKNPKNKDELITDLKGVLMKEATLYQSWSKDIGSNIKKLLNMITGSKTVDKHIYKNYEDFKSIVKDNSGTLASGTLGGYNDGHITSQDLKSATEKENSFKLESLYSRVKELSAEHIHHHLKKTFGENLAGWHLQEGSARMENGQFLCHLISEGAAEPVEFRVKLSPEIQHYNEKILKSLNTAVEHMETHGSIPSHQVNKYVEHTGNIVGPLGFMLGMKVAVRAFEQGDIKDGVIGSLQTAHVVTAMIPSVIARQTLSSETRIAKAAALIMKNPAMKGVLTVIPIVGIGFGIYNVVQDFQRGDTLGYIDAALDISMIVLDVIEIAQPELAPFIVPINLALSVVRMVIDDVYMSVENELKHLAENAGVLEKVLAVIGGSLKGLEHFIINVESFFYDWRYDEIEEGRRLVEQISDYHKYYKVIKTQNGTNAIDFRRGGSSWNGGGINFCLADKGLSKLCMDYFVFTDGRYIYSGPECRYIDTQGSKNIFLGLGESHELTFKEVNMKIFMFIPVGSVRVVSGYKAVSDSRYGRYRGNKDSNSFFASQKVEDKLMTEVMLSYYYSLYGEPGDDIFFLGPQRSYVEGSSGKDTYIIPKDGGKVTINNYDPSKDLDALYFRVDYSHISVSKSGDDVVLMYEGSHTVTIEGWFLGELYRHMNMMSGDGVLFEISSVVVSSVQLLARGINKMFSTGGETVDTSQPLLRTVINILGSQYNDKLIGNGENNLIRGEGGRDHLIGGEGEDIYIVKDRKHSSVFIENYSRDTKTDLAIIEADLHTFTVRVNGDDVLLTLHDNELVHVTLVNWFRSPEDRHLVVVTKDLITFTISENKTDCQHSDPFTKCIKSHSINYSSSLSALVVDLQDDKAFDSVTEVRGSKFNDDIKGNKEHNVVVPGEGRDFLQGRGGEDWYVITPGQGVKTINNQSPDRVLDVLFLKEQYQHITCACEGQSIIIFVHGRKDVILQNWFNSKDYQHLHIKTSDGITAGLVPNISSCGESLMLPITVDYRNQTPEPLLFQTDLQRSSMNPKVYTDTSSTLEDVSVYSFGWDDCLIFRNNNSEERDFCGYEGKVMMVDATSVKEMYGSSGFDIMVGNSNENLLDPYTGGALMFGGEGKDTYNIKLGYGNKLMIDNFAEDLNIDTVSVDMDFLDGSQVTLGDWLLSHTHTWSNPEDLSVTITTKGQQITLGLLNYKKGPQHQHLDFQSADGVKFKLTLNSNGDFQIEAFKVTLKPSQVDCRLDLSSQRNLSKVHTVQGCSSQSSDILGNDQDNALIGGWKDDTLEGGQGDDTLIGGGGDDILIGGLGDDTLYGEDGNDTMMGNSGRDFFIPGPGADLVDGGPGKDTVLYRGDHDTGSGVYVNLLTGQGRYADAEGDVLKDVETVIGTIYSDILVSGYESSLLKGSDGNDILVSTGGDYLVGGDGKDIYMVAFHHGSVTIDNCAKDNATDVLYLSSHSTPLFDCQLLSDRVLLTFFGFNQTTIQITLAGWIRDDDECGHLKLVFREVEVSVQRLLLTCHLREKESVWSSVIISVIGISVVVFHCVFILQTCRKSVLRAQQQKKQKQTGTTADAESVSMVADEM